MGTFLALVIFISIVGCAVLGAITAWRWFFKGLPKEPEWKIYSEEGKWYLRRHYMADTYMYLDRNETSEYWSDICKEQFCAHNTEEEAVKHLMEVCDVKAIYVFRTRSPACQLKKAFYDWLTKDCE